MAFASPSTIAPLTSQGVTCWSSMDDFILSTKSDSIYKGTVSLFNVHIFNVFTDVYRSHLKG